MRARGKPAGQVLCAIVLASSSVLMAACSVSSSTTSASAPARHATAEEAAATATAKAHRDVVTAGVVTHRPLHGTGGNASNDDNPGKADVGNNPTAGQSDPCELVSRTQAQAIVGRPVVTPQEAPLGPTCIYQPVGAKTGVTLTVEGVPLAQLKPHIHHLTRFEVGGRTGYCGVYGQPTTFVPLADGKVLSVTAPCGVGRLFAARALSRVKGA
jgi:hypothetical protein